MQKSFRCLFLEAISEPIEVKDLQERLGVLRSTVHSLVSDVRKDGHVVHKISDGKNTFYHHISGDKEMYRKKDTMIGNVRGILLNGEVWLSDELSELLCITKEQLLQCVNIMRSQGYIVEKKRISYKTMSYQCLGKKEKK